MHEAVKRRRTNQGRKKGKTGTGDEWGDSDRGKGEGFRRREDEPWVNNVREHSNGQDSRQKKVKRVAVLRSKHFCGFTTFFRPHQREFASERGVLTLWLDP